MRESTQILDAYFAGGTVPATLYVGFVDADTFTTFDPESDTMSSHSGWTEFTDYDEAARVPFVPGAVVDNVVATVNNPGKAIITPNVVGRIVGIFFCDNATKGGTTGQLYGPYVLTEGIQETVVGKQFKAEITISLEVN